MLFLTVICLLGTAKLLLRDPDRRRTVWTWSSFAAETVAIETGLREPSPGHLQRAALYAILSLQTVSVTGRVQLPHHVELLMSPEAAAIADSFGNRFLADILTVIQERAHRDGWQTDVVSILIVVDAAIRRFRPTARMGRPHPTGQVADDVTTEPMMELGPSTVRNVGIATVACTGLELVSESHPELAPLRAGSADDLLLVGRCDGDHVVPLSTVSARHCRLRRVGESGWTVEDLGSTNGTYLNGALIKGATALRPGDVLGLGRDVQFRYVR